MFETWIGLPKSEEELQRTMEAYHRLGFTGAVGSTDVTHMSWKIYPVTETRSYKGKEWFSTLAYEVTVDHSIRGRTSSTVATTRCLRGGVNPCCLCIVSALFLRNVLEFVQPKSPRCCVEIYEEYYVASKLVHFLWKCLMAPYEASCNEDQLQWSKRLESVRKDVECFCGILKGRFRILKLPLGFRDEDRIDNMFNTCCILHNMLHVCDGLHDAY
ncbi:unnamed protein product, partial [Discosporangium mesarthrocarpum]